MTACCLGENKPPEREVVLLRGDQNPAEERGWRRRRGRQGERGPAWQAVDVPAPRVVVCTSVTCVENIAAVVAGYRSLRVGANGKARCGTEQSWAQLLLFMLCGREADVQSDCGLLKISWGLVSMGREAGRDRRQPRAFPLSLLVLPCPWPDAGARPWGSFHLWFAAHPHLQQLNPYTSLLCSGGPGRSQIHFFLFSVLKTIVKFLKRG